MLTSFVLCELCSLLPHKMPTRYNVRLTWSCAPHPSPLPGKSCSCWTRKLGRVRRNIYGMSRFLLPAAGCYLHVHVCASCSPAFSSRVVADCREVLKEKEGVVWGALAWCSLIPGARQGSASQAARPLVLCIASMAVLGCCCCCWAGGKWEQLCCCAQGGEQ